MSYRDERRDSVSSLDRQNTFQSRHDRERRGGGYTQHSYAGNRRGRGGVRRPSSYSHHVHRTSSPPSHVLSFDRAKVQAEHIKPFPRDRGFYGPRRGGREYYSRRQSLDRRDRETSVTYFGDQQNSRSYSGSYSPTRSRQNRLPMESTGATSPKYSSPGYSTPQWTSQDQDVLFQAPNHAHRDRAVLSSQNAQPTRYTVHSMASQRRRNSGGLCDSKNVGTSTRNEKLPQPLGGKNGLSAEDGHQWAKSRDENITSKGRRGDRGWKYSSVNRGRGSGHDRSFASRAPQPAWEHSSRSPLPLDQAKRWQWDS